MSFWSNLFGSSETVDKIVSGGISAGDMVFYTPEEKAIAEQKLLEFRLRYMEATNPQNVARRVIAFMVVGLWVFLILLGVAAKPFSAEYSDFVFKVLKDVVDTPESIVLGFYFLTHMVRSARSKT